MRAAACLTATVSTEDQLQALLQYDAGSWSRATAASTIGLTPVSPAQLPALSPAHLHVTLAANISLDAPRWAAAPPQLVRPLTTLSGDCRTRVAAGGHVTALDLSGGRNIIAARRGGKLRLLCLELANLATNTAILPRGLLTGGVWAMDVDLASGSLLLVDNCTLVMSKDEFMWQSYYMAQMLASTVVGSGVLKVLNLEGTMSSTELRWIRASSPRTQWRETVLTSTPTVFPNTQPNSVVLKYLGLTLYLTNLVLVSNCTELLTAVRGASEAQPALVLRASISLAACWPAGGVAVPPVPNLYLMGLPDQPIHLDLAGREDAFQLSSVTMVSVRYLTLRGLPAHLDDLTAALAASGSASSSSSSTTASDSHSAGAAIQTVTAAGGTSGTAPAADGKVTYSPLDATGDGGMQFPALATAFLWSFHFPRLVTQLQLEHVYLVLPEAELQQYGAMLNGSSFLPYFSQLRPFFQSNRISAEDNSTAASNGTANSSATATGARAVTVATTSSTGSAEPPELWFPNLLLPGMRVYNATMVSEAGAYPGWNESMYAAPAAGGDSSGGGGAGWPAGRIAVVAAVLGASALLAAGGALLYARTRKSGAARGADGSKGAGRNRGKPRRRSHDIETGGGASSAERCSIRRGSAADSSSPSTSGAVVAAANNGRRGGGAGAAAAAGNAELRVASGGAGRGGGGGGGGGAGGAAGGDGFERHPLYDSFDDPAFELDFLKGAKKLSPDDVADVLERINREAVEFNITMTEICGSGSFGVVYGGLWNGIKVAIKTMVFGEAAGGGGQLAGQAARQQCIKEAAFCCTMHHANVVATHHFYLKSANRASMFDDLLQVAEKRLGSSSDEEEEVAAAYRPMRMRKATEQEEQDSMPPPRCTPLQPRTSSSGLGVDSIEQSEAAGKAAPQQPEERVQKLVQVRAGLQLAQPQPARNSMWPRRTQPKQPKPIKPRPKPNVTDWRLYLIQEYCDGGTLRQAVDDGKLFRHGGSERGPQTPSAGNSAALPHIPTAEAMRFAGAPVRTRGATGTATAGAAVTAAAVLGSTPSSPVVAAPSLLDVVQSRAKGRISPVAAGGVDTVVGPGDGACDEEAGVADKPTDHLYSNLQPAATGAALMLVCEADGDVANGAACVAGKGDGTSTMVVAAEGQPEGRADVAAAARPAAGSVGCALLAPVSHGDVRRLQTLRPRLQHSPTCESASVSTYTNASGSNFATLMDTGALNTTDSNLACSAAVAIMMGASAMATATAIEAGTLQQQAATIAPFPGCGPNVDACLVSAELGAAQSRLPTPASADAGMASSSIFEAFVTAHNASRVESSPPQTARLPAVSASDEAPHTLDSGHNAVGSSAVNHQHHITLSDMPPSAFRCSSQQGSTERNGSTQAVTANNMLLPGSAALRARAARTAATTSAAAAGNAGRSSAQGKQQQDLEQQGDRQQQQQQQQQLQQQQYVRQDRPLPADLALVVQTALGVASGVAYLHSRNIIHGDLSANNVLLMRTPSPALPVVAKVSDFGLSLRLSDGQDQVKNVRHGTPYYQSPEVAEQGTCSLAADVYSVGVLLWELYHGPPPWRARRANNRNNKGGGLAAQQARLLDPAGDLAQAREAAEAGGWDDPHYRLRACDVLAVAPHCPSAYARLVRRCLCADPRDRPTARSVVKALLRMERGIAAAQAVSGAMASASSLVTGPPMGALMALSRPRAAPSSILCAPGGVGAGIVRSGLNTAGASRSPSNAGGGGSGPGGIGHSACTNALSGDGADGAGGAGGGGVVSRLDAAMLLEDFDAAAAAVAAAVAAVTARPAAAGAAACAGAAARALAEYDDDALIAVGLEPAVVREARQPKPVNLSRRGSTLPQAGGGLTRAFSTESSDMCDPMDPDAGALAAAAAAAAAVCGTEADLHVVTRQPSQHRAAVAAAVAVARAVASVTSTLSNNIAAPGPICASATLSNTLFGRSATGLSHFDAAAAGAGAGAAAAAGAAGSHVVPAALRRGATGRLQEQQPAATRSVLLGVNSGASSITASGFAARGSTEPTVLAVPGAAQAETEAPHAAGSGPGVAAVENRPAAVAAGSNANLCMMPRGGRQASTGFDIMDL
ncbi:hypothetical protein HYH02_010807 [Chlamydomonas schloesseri]|uniref:Protein kinase domain-containing protein n=1 Tax=Chlamydomonas schloesseri TaxID=2026947 RepID=A0A835THF1_9CHLO|nr:hypothetical protein HYH02_010807 [Chlamydomonas schloesseri]|eukprot:KAG2438351.1 hypothetical protein HYH02_010807 [Chlamydomonas schloesseri]